MISGLKILSITLIRDESQYDMFNENLVKSILQITCTVKNKFRMYRMKVIENREYLFPKGVYELQLEYSPKFRRHLWEFKDIPNRTEIKFHQGSEPEHSKGCPLMTKRDLDKFMLLLFGKEKYYITVNEY